MNPEIPGDEVPEADAIEQLMPVDDLSDEQQTVPHPDLQDEVPEADALEQAIEIPDDEYQVDE